MKNKGMHILSIIIAILTFSASIGGLLINNLYRDTNSNVLKAWYINDLITLVVALPLFVFAIIFSIKGSKRSLLILLGMLDYCLYNFTFYLFGATLNLFFPIYVAIFTLSVFAIVIGITKVDIQELKTKSYNTRYYRVISVYMFIWAGILGIAWIGQWFNFALTGKMPQIMLDMGSSNFLIGAIDLSFVVSVVIFTAVWLWQRRPWGYVLSVICNVKGAVYTVVLMAGSLVQARDGAEGALALMGLWMFIFIGCLLSTIALLWNKKQTKSCGGDL